MSFGIDKCATAFLVRGKLTSCENIVVTADTIIPPLNTCDSSRLTVVSRAAKESRACDYRESIYMND